MFKNKGRSGSRLFLVILCLFSSAVWSSEPLRVGVYENPPKFFTSEQNQPRGLFIEILEEVAQRENWEIDYVHCEWFSCLELLSLGQLDLMPDVAINESRSARFAFHSTPALHSWSQIYRHPEADIQSLLNLQGKRIALLEGSIQQPSLEQLLEGFEIAYTPVKASSLDETFDLVAKGQADAAIANYQYGGYRAEDFGLKETPIVLMPSKLFFAAPPGQHQEILARLDHYLNRWQRENNSPYYQILGRWGVLSSDTLVPVFLRNTLIGLVILGGILLIGVLVLRSQVHRRTLELEVLNKHLEHLAHYDLLTGLPNYILLTERLQARMQEANHSGELLLVAFIDLDSFKDINDRYGSAKGDRLLTALSRELHCSLAREDLLGRAGGDEFVVVMTGLEDTQDGIKRSKQLLTNLSRTYQLGELQLSVSGSMGLCFYPQQEVTTAEQLIRQANQAMYQAKLEGKNGCYVFDAEKERDARGYYETLERIRQGLSQEEFVLFYQPKVNLRTGEVVGAEALIRWQHPERGLLPPAAFLPVLEGQPLDAELGSWVLKTALQQMLAWQTAGFKMPVSVNISAYHLQQPDFVRQLSQLLEKHQDVRPADLELEVLETSALEDVKQISVIMKEASQLGVGFALDDFGTGYSSLTYLKRLPAGLLKIDRSFVCDLLVDEEDKALVEGVIRLAAAFQRQVIAEGVETQAHGDLLLKLGCELAQGYGIARPLPAAELIAWKKRWMEKKEWTA